MMAVAQERAALLTRDLQASGLTICPGVMHEGDTHREALRRAARSLRSRVEISVFPWARVVGRTALGFIDRHGGEDVGSVGGSGGLALTLDVSMMSFCGMTVEEIASFASKTRHVQFRPGTRDKIQVPMKHNEIDFDPIL